MKVGNILWTKKTKLRGSSKINEHIKRNLYTWITRHPQVFQSPISNDCLKVLLDDQTEPQLVPKLLLQVSVRELHNSLVSDPNDGGMKDDRYEDGKVVISDSTLRSLLPPKLKQMSALYKIMCGCECCIYDKSIHSSLLSWRDRYLKKSMIKYKTLKAKGLVRKHITYIYINRKWSHVGVIFMPKHLIRQMQQCAFILILIMHFHTGNLYCGDVPTVIVLIFLTKKKMKKMKK